MRTICGAVFGRLLYCDCECFEYASSGVKQDGVRPLCITFSIYLHVHEHERSNKQAPPNTHTHVAPLTHTHPLEIDKGNEEKSL